MTLVIQTIVTLLLVVLIAKGVNAIEDYHNNKKIPIPFKESMDLLSVPVVTFSNGGVKLHFLLDTGGDYSYIDKEVIPALQIKNASDNSIKIATSSTSMESSGTVTMDICYMGHAFEETFVVGDLKSQLDAAFGSYGVTVHGVLGSGFFAKYKYELNFEDFTAYSKK